MRYLILLIVCISTTCISQISDTDQLIISKLIEKYATCSSYQDSGQVEITIMNHQSDRQSVNKSNFNTVFIRDKGFRFSFNKYWPDSSQLSHRMILHKDADSTLSTYYVRFLNQEPKVERLALFFGIASLTGTTSGVVKFVPPLLFKNELIGLNFLKPAIGEFERIQDEIYSGEDCYKFKSILEFDKNKGFKFFEKFKDVKDEPDIVRIETVSWFGKQDSLLKKIETKQSSNDQTSNTVITYQATINKEIDHKLLELNPSKE